jgi:hypothetical protein
MERLWLKRFSPSFDEILTEVQPLCSTGITPLPCYYGPLRLPAVTSPGYGFPFDVSPPAKPFALGFTPGLPGSLTVLLTRAPPITPGSLTGSFIRLFPINGRLHHLREAGHCQFRVTRPNQVCLHWAHVFAVQGVSLPFALSFLLRTSLFPLIWFEFPSYGRLRLHAERTICMSDTFQSDRAVRLCLAYRKTRKRTDSIKFRVFRDFRGKIDFIFIRIY